MKEARAESSSSYGARQGLWSEMGAHRHGGSLLLKSQEQSLSVEGDGDDGSLMLFTSTKK